MRSTTGPGLRMDLGRTAWAPSSQPGQSGKARKTTGKPWKAKRKPSENVGLVLGNSGFPENVALMGFIDDLAKLVQRSPRTIGLIRGLYRTS